MSSPPVVIKPESKDVECWTHQPEYERFLYVRVHSPDDLKHTQLKCVLTYQDQFYKTNILDETPEQPVVEESPIPEAPTAPKPTKSRGLIGTRGTKSTSPTDSPPNISPTGTKSKLGRYEQCVFELPVDKHIKGSETVSTQQQMRIAVHQGPKEEIIAMATIDMDDLNSLDLPVFEMPAPIGDEWPPSDKPKRKKKMGSADEALSPSLSRYHEDDVEDSPIVKLQKQMKEFTEEISAINFPLYSVKPIKGEPLNTSVGTLPLVIFWATKPSPFALNRLIETESMRDVILDILGLDMYEVTKEDLHREMEDKALSIMSYTPEPTEEVVPRSEYERVMSTHTEEVDLLKQEYELQLQELVVEMQQLQVSQAEKEEELQAAIQAAALRPSLTPSRARTPHDRRTPMAKTPPTPVARSPQLMAFQPTMPEDFYRQQQMSAVDAEEESEQGFDDHYEDAVKPRSIQVPLPAQEQTQGKKKNFRVGKPLPNWGEDLPKDFFERQQLFDEEMKMRRHDLIERLSEEIANKVERKLASEFKLNRHKTNESNTATQDVSLPAVFLPHKSNNMLIFNPRAHKYFHPTGSSGVRLTQPPSMVQLPPLPKNRINVVNLFNLGANIQGGDTDWLMKRYLQQPSYTDMSHPMPTTPNVSFVTNPQMVTTDSRPKSVPESQEREAPQ